MNVHVVAIVANEINLAAIRVDERGHHLSDGALDLLFDVVLQGGGSSYAALQPSRLAGGLASRRRPHGGANMARGELSLFAVLG